MTEFVRFLCGYYRVRIRGAAPEQALNRLTQEHVAFWDIQRIDDFASDISTAGKIWSGCSISLQKCRTAPRFSGKPGCCAISGA